MVAVTNTAKNKLGAEAELLAVKEKNSFYQNICSICYTEISRDSQAFWSHKLGIEL